MCAKPSQPPVDAWVGTRRHRSGSPCAVCTPYVRLSRGHHRVVLGWRFPGLSAGGAAVRAGPGGLTVTVDKPAQASGDARSLSLPGRAASHPRPGSFRSVSARLCCCSGFCVTVASSWEAVRVPGTLLGPHPPAPTTKPSANGISSAQGESAFGGGVGVRRWTAGDGACSQDEPGLCGAERPAQLEPSQPCLAPLGSRPPGPNCGRCGGTLPKGERGPWRVGCGDHAPERDVPLGPSDISGDSVGTPRLAPVHGVRVPGVRVQQCAC